MTCADVEQLQDAFVDAELPGPMLLAVARHAGSCATCDEILRGLGAMREVIAQVVQRDAGQLDLAPVWPAVAAGLARSAPPRRSRVRALPVWGAAVAALAAATVLWFQGFGPMPTPEPVRVAAARQRPNHAVIERLNVGSSRVSLRRERKNGTTLIMVSAAGNEVLR